MGENVAADLKGLLEIPHSEMIEQAVLGIAMGRPDLVDAVGPVCEDDFYNEDWASAWRFIETLRSTGRTVSPFTVATFYSHPSIAAADMNALAVMAPHTLHGAKSAGEELRRLSARRKLKYLGEAVANDAAEDAADTPEAMIARAQQALSEILPPTPNKSSMSSELDRILDRAEDASRDTSVRVMSGLTDWDRRIGGMRAGELHIIGARPGMGKTIVGANMAVNVALAGKGALYFSMEISREQLIQRVLCDLVQRDGHELWTRSLRAGNIMPTLMRPLIKARDTLEALPIVIEEQRGLSLAEIAAKARMVRRDLRANGKDLEIIVVDYMTLIQPADRYKGNKVAEVTELSRGLKILAGDMGIPVVALCQLNRNTESRQNQDSKPRLSDLRESGSIEQDADSVTLLFREEYYVLLSEPGLKGTDAYAHWEAKLLEVRDRLEMIVAKNREGETGTVEVKVLARCSAVRDA